MKYIEKLLYKFPVILMLIISLLGVSTAKSQIGLTKALDFDGDGKADPVVFRPKENGWWSAKSSGGAGVASFGDAAIDSPVPGDYDGDGKTDIAIWRNTDRVFYIVQSSNNLISYKYWGEDGDLPIASYDTH